jgi:hypothetical protein
LYSKDGTVDKEALRKARIYTIIDHLCDKDGNNLFADSDIKELLDLDALKLDVLTKKIEEWVESREGKILGE